MHSKDNIAVDTRSPVINKVAANEEIFSEEEFWCTRKLRRKNNRNNIDMLYDTQREVEVARVFHKVLN